MSSVKTWSDNYYNISLGHVHTVIFIQDGWRVHVQIPHNKQNKTKVSEWKKNAKYEQIGL